MTWAAYQRVSTSMQADSGLGLDAQRAKIEAWAAYHGRGLVWFTDAGVSGGKRERPGLDAALAAAKAGEVEGIVVAKLDRLSRSVRHLLDLAEALDADGTKLASCEEQLDTSTAMGRFVLTIFGALAELERGLISERTTAALAVKRARGEYLGGRAPYGYRVADGVLEVNDDEQRAAKRAANLRDEGLSLRAIAATLDQEGFTPRGRVWGPKAVSRALSARLED